MMLASGIKEVMMGYSDLSDIARQRSINTRETCNELYRRMVFNVFIENTDDHEKNHAFILNQGEWSLSPAYDISPQLQGLGFHQLRIGDDGKVATATNIISQHKRFLLSRPEAVLIISDVYQVFRTWKKVFSEAGVSDRDIALCDRFVLRKQIFNQNPPIAGMIP